MSILNRLASVQGTAVAGSDLANQTLTRDLAASKDKKAIREVAQNLQNKDPNIQSDCIKVLYEIGYLKPELIAAFADEFLDLLGSRNNRLVWSSLIALSTIASRKADELFHIGQPSGRRWTQAP